MRIPVWARNSRKLKRTMFIISAALASHLFASSLAWSAQFAITVDPANTCTAIAISGELTPLDYQSFITINKKAQLIAPVRRLYLQSQGGNIVSAMAITEYLLQTSPRLDAIVPSHSACNSACVILLAAGARRFAAADSLLVIHQAFDPLTGQRDAAMTLAMGEFIAKHGMPEVLPTMRNLKPDTQLEISPSTAKRLGFESLIFYGGSDPPATPGCHWPGFLLDR